MSASKRLTDLIKNTQGQRGKVIADEATLLEKFTKAGCTTKMDMVEVLYNENHSVNDIAVTLQKHGILTEKSAYQMTRNYIQNIDAKRAKERKTA